MGDYWRSILSLSGVVVLHGAAIGTVLWVPTPTVQDDFVPPVVQGILLPAPPAEAVQMPSAQEIPPAPEPEPVKPPEPEKPKPEMPKSEEARKIPQPEPDPPPPPQETLVEEPPQEQQEARPPPQAAVPDAEVDDTQGAPVTPPRMDANPLNNPSPAYPMQSRRLKEQGTVLLEILILADGSVGEVRVKESSGHQRLDDTAVQAVKRWRYRPAQRGGQPIEYWYLQPVEFSLN